MDGVRIKDWTDYRISQIRKCTCLIAKQPTTDYRPLTTDQNLRHIILQILVALGKFTIFGYSSFLDNVVLIVHQ